MYLLKYQYYDPEFFLNSYSLKYPIFRISRNRNLRYNLISRLYCIIYLKLSSLTPCKFIDTSRMAQNTLDPNSILPAPSILNLCYL